MQPATKPYQSQPMQAQQILDTDLPQQKPHNKYTHSVSHLFATLLVLVLIVTYLCPLISYANGSSEEVLGPVEKTVQSIIDESSFRSIAPVNNISATPEYNAGWVMIIEQCDFSDIAIGDIAAVKTNRTYALLKVIAKDIKLRTITVESHANNNTEIINVDDYLGTVGRAVVNLVPPKNGQEPQVLRISKGTDILGYRKSREGEASDGGRNSDTNDKSSGKTGPLSLAKYDSLKDAILTTAIKANVITYRQVIDVVYGEQAESIRAAKRAYQVSHKETQWTTDLGDDSIERRINVNVVPALFLDFNRAGLPSNLKKIQIPVPAGWDDESNIKINSSLVKSDDTFVQEIAISTQLCLSPLHRLAWPKSKRFSDAAAISPEARQMLINLGDRMTLNKAAGSYETNNQMPETEFNFIVQPSHIDICLADLNKVFYEKFGRAIYTPRDAIEALIMVGAKINDKIAKQVLVSLGDDKYPTKIEKIPEREVLNHPYIKELIGITRSVKGSNSIAMLIRMLITRAPGVM